MMHVHFCGFGSMNWAGFQFKLFYVFTKYRSQQQMKMYDACHVTTILSISFVREILKFYNGLDG